MVLKMVKVRKRIRNISILVLSVILAVLVFLYVNKTEEETSRILKRTKEKKEIELIVHRMDEESKNNAQIEEIANRLNEVFEFKLAGQGKLYASYSLEKGVDPYLAAAISIHETYRGASEEVTKYNNVGGMRSGGKTIEFDTLEAGIIRYIDNLANNYYAYGLDTPDKMQKKYAASTSWAKNVNYFYTKIKDGSYKAGLPLNTKYASSEWY